jgi:hypothetical protein
MFSKPHKISTNSTMGAQRLDFYHFLAPFDTHFSSNFGTHPNLLNCNKHGVKTLLLPLLASHFGIENLLKIHVFSRHALGPNFSSFYMNLCQKARFLDPVKIQWASKWHQKSTHLRQNMGKRDDRLLQGRIPETSSRPSCHATRFRPQLKRNVVHVGSFSVPLSSFPSRRLASILG